MKYLFFTLFTFLFIQTGFASDRLQVEKSKIEKLNQATFSVQGLEKVVSEKLIRYWTGNDWINSTRTKIDYNAAGALIQELEEIWIASQWVNSNRYSYSYLQNVLTESFRETWRTTEWDSISRLAYFYNLEAQLEQVVTLTNANPGWFPLQREQYVYNQAALVSELIYQQPLSTTEWRYTDRFVSTYNENGQITELIGQRSPNGSDNWADDSKVEFSYDDQGIESGVLAYSWSSFAGEWYVTNRTINTVVDGEITIKTNQTLFDTLWADITRDVFAYNPDGTVSSITKQQSSNKVWQNFELSSFSYEEITGIDQTGETVSTFKLYDGYPNPFNPVTTIKYTIPQAGQVQLQVFDITGKLVRSLVDQSQVPGTYSVQFDAGDLASGIYFYQLQTAGFIATKKLMLVK